MQGAAKNLDQIVSRLSGRALKRCVANGLASQAKNPQAAEMIKCLGKSGDQAQACASAVGQQVLGPNERKQIEEVNKTFAELAKINASNPAEGGKSNPRDYPQQPLALYNMIQIAEGVRDNRHRDNHYQWRLGALPDRGRDHHQLLSARVGPRSRTGRSRSMILNHTIAIQQGFDAVVKGDPVGLAEAAAEWYCNHVHRPDVQR